MAGVGPTSDTRRPLWPSAPNTSGRSLRTGTTRRCRIRSGNGNVAPHDQPPPPAGSGRRSLGASVCRSPALLRACRHMIGTQRVDEPQHGSQSVETTSNPAPRAAYPACVQDHHRRATLYVLHVPQHGAPDDQHDPVTAVTTSSPSPSRVGPSTRRSHHAAGRSAPPEQRSTHHVARAPPATRRAPAPDPPQQSATQRANHHGYHHATRESPNHLSSYGVSGGCRSGGSTSVHWVGAWMRSSNMVSKAVALGFSPWAIVADLPGRVKGAAGKAEAL